MVRSVARTLMAVGAFGLAGGCAQLDGPSSSEVPPSSEAAPRPDTEPAPAASLIAPVPAHPPSQQRSESRVVSRTRRSAQIGDILTVDVNVDERMIVSSAPKQQTVGAGEPRSAGPGSAAGQLTASRRDPRRMSVAAVITQVLPDGRLAIEGRRAAQIGGAVVEVAIAGVIRSQDVGNGKTIDASKIAQARIWSRWRGNTDAQRQGQ
ncbi:flagellar basal body L-ring protein FlgH [Bradyrhizobium oligotrophicum]|nr:flagellar basal body L-ring protein FlgH [Bradyrhizobium oligotrophicum]